MRAHSYASGMARAFSARSRCLATAAMVFSNEIFITHTGCESMTDDRQQAQAFIVINLDRGHQSVSHIAAVLEPLGIRISTVESERRLRWTSAVVLSVPDERLGDAMLALDLTGFSDVMAFHREADGDARTPGVEAQ